MLGLPGGEAWEDRGVGGSIRDGSEPLLCQTSSGTAVSSLTHSSWQVPLAQRGAHGEAKGGPRWVVSDLL